MPLIRRAGRPGLLGTMARTAVVAGTATAVSGAVANHQHQRTVAQQEAAREQAQAASAQPMPVTPEPPAPPAPPAASAGSDIIAKLQQLGELHQQGVLSDAEFAQAKALILGT